MTEAKKTLPGSDDLERKALAAAFVSLDWWDGADVRRDDMGSDVRARIFDALSTLRARATGPQDMSHANLRLEVERLQRLPKGVWQELSYLPAYGATLSEMELVRLREFTVCRRLARITWAVEASIATGDLAKVREMIEMANDQTQLDISERTYTAHELANTFFQKLLVKPEDQQQWPDPGIIQLRNHLGGYPPGSLIVVAARPNVGKSGFSLATAEGSSPAGTVCGIVSCEDQEDILAPRLLAMKSGISARHMQRRRVGPGEVPNLRRGVVALEKLNLFVEFAVGADHLAVRQSMRRLARKGARLLMVDYLQVVRCADKSLERHTAIGVILTDWKKEAKRLGCALIVFNQLRRKNQDEKRASRRKNNTVDNRPSLEELKESGDIEEKADVVLMMWRNENRDDAPVNVACEKVKWGGVGYEFQMQRGEDGVLRSILDPDDVNSGIQEQQPALF